MEIIMLEICHMKTEMPKNLVGWLELVTRLFNHPASSTWLEIGLATWHFRSAYCTLVEKPVNLRPRYISTKL
jgi:hypothetical protein